MLIIAGHLIVAPEDRDAYVADCAVVVERARTSPGCLDFSLTADPLDVARVNVYERWATEEELTAFRGSGPDTETAGRLVSAAVRRYEVSGEGPP